MYSTRQFLPHAKTMSLTAEISELGGLRFIQAYPDACDIGIDIVSHVTGKESRWVQVQESRNDDGDITDWKFVPTADTIRKIPSLRNWKVVVFND